MRLALSKTAIESQVADRLGDVFKLNNREAAEVLCTGITEIDAFVGGLPRGAITEVFGPASSGRTSFMLSALAHATNHEEICALVDTNNAFDPTSAVRAEMNCERLLWIRCANNLEHAFKATDLLLQGGGFGLVTLDLGDVPAKSAKRIISSWWYRFRRTLEATPTALVVIAEESCVRSCASLALELRTETCLWSGSSEVSDGFLNKFTNGNTRSSSQSRSSLSAVPARGVVDDLHPRMNQNSPPHSNLLQGLHFQVECQRPLYLNKREDVFVKVAH
jgi:hypothetical protein